VADSIRSIQELVSLGVRFLAVTQNLDTAETNPMSRFLLHILAAFSELEREMIRERVRAGLRTAKAQGKALGRPRRAFRRDEAVRLRSQGQSWRKIAQVLDLPMSTVIRACSENPPPRWAPGPQKTRHIADANRPFQRHMICERLRRAQPSSSERCSRLTTIAACRPFFIDPPKTQRKGPHVTRYKRTSFRL